MNRLWKTGILAAALSNGCASTSPRYYTLLPEPERGPPAIGAPNLKLTVARVPAQVDRLELVVRLPDGGIAIADGERWAAPVADELQTALSLELLHQIGPAAATSGTAPGTAAVSVGVERFEGSLSRYALIEASWRFEFNDATRRVLLVCRTSAYERAGDGYARVVNAYRRAVIVIADQIATVARESFSGSVAACPSVDH